MNATAPSSLVRATQLPTDTCLTGRQLRQFALVLLAIDLGILLVAAAVGWSLRFQWLVPVGVERPTDQKVVVCVSLTVLWVALLFRSGVYSVRVIGAGVEEFRRIAVASALTACAVGLVCYMLRFELARGFLLITMVVGTAGLMSGRHLARRALHRRRRQGRMVHRVLAVGSVPAVQEIAAALERAAFTGYRVVAACTPNGSSPNGHKLNVPIVGTPSQVGAACKQVVADTVLVTGGAFSTSAEMRRVGWALEGSSIDLIVAPTLMDVAGPRIHVRPVAGLPLVHVDPPQASAASRWGKRYFDLVLASLLLLWVSPLMLAVILAIRLDDGGPVFYRQERVGKGGQRFSCWKFRTMSTDAERRLADLMNGHQHNGLLFKLPEDPRVTRVGRYLRRFSLDELPQLVNVLRGEMSLVGPRPQVAREVAQYNDDYARRLLVRPGMTGLWQVSGRSNLSLNESERLDVLYVDNWSMVADLVILARTLRAVVSGHGAV